MKQKRRIIIFIIAVLLLITAAGCGSDELLWKVLEEQQYNSYKPLLDHMVEKYGDMFEMNVYGDVYCTDAEYHNWRIRIAGGNKVTVKCQQGQLAITKDETRSDSGESYPLL